MTFETFKSRVAAASEDTDIDDLCISWLCGLATSHGREGAVAKVLLTQVKVLLEIY